MMRSQQVQDASTIPPVAEHPLFHDAVAMAEAIEAEYEVAKAEHQQAIQAARFPTRPNALATAMHGDSREREHATQLERVTELSRRVEAFPIAISEQRQNVERARTAACVEVLARPAIAARFNAVRERMGSALAELRAASDDMGRLRQEVIAAGYGLHSLPDERISLGFSTETVMEAIDREIRVIHERIQR